MIKHGRIAVAAIAAFSLGACSLVPDFTDPAIDAPPQWDTASANIGVWPDQAWWRGFNSAELNGLIARAQAQSTDLRAAYYRILQAEAQAKISGASLYPTLDAAANAQRSRTGPNAGSSSTSNSTSTATTRQRSAIVRNSFSGGLTAGYQIDLFGGNAAAADSALASLQSSRFDRETVAITLYTDVASAYFQLLSLRDRIRLANETLNAVVETLNLLETQYRLGSTTEYEVAQQRSAVATQRSAIAALEQQERSALDALAVLVGTAPQGFTITGRSLADIALPPVVSGMPSELLLRRPDLRKLESGLRAANFDIGVARAARFPSLNLTGAISSQTGLVSDLWEPNTMIYSIAAGLTAPIFQGGRLEGAEEQRRARLEELVEQYRGGVLTAFRDTEDALYASAATGRQYAFAEEALTQARASYRVVEARFRAGTVGFLDLLTAQRTIFAANDTLVQSALGRYTATVDLYKALGGGWDGNTLPPSTAAK